MKVQNNLFDPQIAIPKHHLSFTRSTLRSEQTHPIPSLSQMLKKQRWCTVRFHRQSQKWVFPQPSSCIVIPRSWEYMLN